MKSGYLVFDAFKTNSAGVWYFAPSDGLPFDKKRKCKGFGAIKYGEGSVYTGDIYFDGMNFNKLGNGQQDFSHSLLGATDKKIGEKKYKFVGKFDYRKTDWIYGNGVLYYTDIYGNPTHFLKGFFSGLTKTGEYQGEFDYSDLLVGYASDNEFYYDESRERLDDRINVINNNSECAGEIDTLFIGDSYFELADDIEFAGNNLLSKTFTKRDVNAGIGGSKFSDWLLWFERFRFSAPRKIAVNLGFNDLHSGLSVNKVFSDCVKFIKVLNSEFPQSEIFLISVIHSPDFIKYRQAEDEYNKKISSSSARSGINILDWNERIDKSGKNCFHSDRIHPNEEGYALFTEFLKSNL